ncbi:MAG: bifunctional 3,4-dihydroxy-2-butanone-4-phosphate synthase/GTP cyclohydrolase II [Coriobacteriia bacterium]|nr:bifunctional 3,4-dihydroxy-2-butanone-4-phosphate synthase/GTP cyclohydrolase II [Coriobacteriia bacterium]
MSIQEQNGKGKFSSIDEALEDVKRGKPIIVVDDEDRENEGDVVIAAAKATPDTINFFIKYARGLVCLPMMRSRLDELGIPPMVEVNTSEQGTAFHVSIGAKGRITTGISAADRWATVDAAIDANATSDDISMPGHVFPLAARAGGVLERAGHTEAAVDLARLAGLYPAGVICEIIKEDGTMARRDDLFEFAAEHDMKIITVEKLIRYRRHSEKLIEHIATADMPTRAGYFTAEAYESKVDGRTHIALVAGEIGDGENVLVRVHSECLTGDVFHSLRCDCGAQFDKAAEEIQKEGRGILLYMVGQEGRGIGLGNKMRAYELQDKGADTVEANIALGFAPDLREYGIGAQILSDLGVKSLRLLTNNPKKVVGLEGYGMEILSQEPITAGVNSCNIGYLRTKNEKMNHSLEL